MPTARINQFLSSDEAVSSIEYVLLGAFIAQVCVVAVTAVGRSARDPDTAVCNEVAKVSTNPACR